MVETALVLEMATGGELQTLLDEAGSLNEQQTVICMQEVLKALQFLHKKSIAHLDLKPQNILLCGERVEGMYRYKLRFRFKMNSNCVRVYIGIFLPLHRR